MQEEYLSMIVNANTKESYINYINNKDKNIENREVYNMNTSTIPRSRELRLEDLRKDLEKYKENVNKCNVSMIDALSFNIGSNIEYIKFVLGPTTDDQKNMLKSLEKEYNTHSNKVKQCQCVRKLER